MITHSKKYTYDYPRPAVTVDVVVFSLLEDRLCTLLIRRKNEPFAGCWALPGGFLDDNEDIENAALRELSEETNLKELYIEQLYSFGRPDRDPRGRTITVAYYSLLPATRMSEIAHGDDAAEAQWFGLDQLPDLAFDHDEIIDCAVERLKGKLQYTTVSFCLLPERFSFTQLQKVYEAIWQKPLDRRNFRKWINSFNLLEDTGEKISNGRRPASLYQLKSKNETPNGLQLLQRER